MEDLCTDGRIILGWNLNKYDRRVEWIHLAQDMQGLMNTVMKLGSIKCGEFLD